MQEIWIRSLDWEDPLEEEMATLSSILSWKIPWTGGWWAIIHGVARSRTRLSDEHTQTSVILRVLHYQMICTDFHGFWVIMVMMTWS